MKNYKKAIFLMVVLLSVGCTAIDQHQAETKALQFVNENVKFYARQENSTINFPRYSVDAIKSYQESKSWIVIVHVSAAAGNETKKSDLIVKLNKRGDVIEFNGKKV